MKFIILHITLIVRSCAVLAQGEGVAEKEIQYADAQLRCFMNKDCKELQTCELPCKIVQKGNSADQARPVTSFIDEEFEDLWDEMQDKMKGLNDHQEELLAQQDDLLGKQKSLEKENERLQGEQAKLLERQEYLEAENERLKALSPQGEVDEDIRVKLQNLETKIRVLTEQQKKLSKQQTRLVALQNKLMARQRKLENENAKLKKRQDGIESRGFGATPSPVPTSEIQENEVPTVQPVDPRVESKLKAIKEEMQHRIDQMNDQQEELLREQNKLIGRQERLEEENQSLREKQLQLQEKQTALEKENHELKLNLTHRTEDPEMRRQRIKATGLCELEHENVCYGLLGDGSDELTFDLAQENCRLYGGDLANIYGQVHYEKTKDYFLNKTISSGVWLGMTYNPMNYKTYFSNGTETTFVKWNWVYPVSFSSYTGIYLYVDKDPQSIYSGMVNLPPTWKYPYALCQFGRA